MNAQKVVPCGGNFHVVAIACYDLDTDKLRLLVYDDFKSRNLVRARDAAMAKAIDLWPRSRFAGHTAFVHGLTVSIAKKVPV